MLPNQNISIWMAPLPTATPETPLPFSFRSTRGTTLLKKKFEKEWETVWEVFPELSDTRFLHKKTIFLPEPQFS